MLTVGAIPAAFRASRALIMAWIEALSSPVERPYSRQSGSSPRASAAAETSALFGGAVRRVGWNGGESQPFWLIGWPS